MGDLLMKLLLAEYIVIALVYCWESNYPKALYWFSAGLLNISLLWGMK